MSYCQQRSPISESKKADLLDAIARRASAYSTPELLHLLKWDRVQLSYLRNRRVGHFGWERLLYAAGQLGVSVDVRIGEAA